MEDIKIKDSKLNSSKHSHNLISCACNFDLLLCPANTLILLHFQRIYYLALYYISVLHSADET